MGIEGFFKTVEKIDGSGIMKNYNKITDINFFYIDFNSILYNISGSIEDQLGILLCDIVYGKEPDKETLKLFNLMKPTIASYNDKFNKTSDQLDQFIIGQVLNYLESLFEKFINQNTLKKIFIAFDGVPEMGKIIEQKHRKYMGYVAGELMKKIDKEYNASERRKIVEENRYRFDRTKLVTWSKFMEQMYEELIGEKFTERIKYMFPNLESYDVSGAEYAGEGEKKIMEVMIPEFKNKNNTFCVLSPDADLVLLAMILTNINYYNYKDNLNYINVMHYNQETDNYSYVNTDKFINFICKYVKKDLDKKYDIANDFIMIANLIGNDFLPKIMSLNVKSDFNLLLDVYKDLNKTIVKYDHNKNKFEIINKNLVNYLENLAKLEPELIKHKYLMQNYDIHRIRKAFNYNYDSIYLVKKIEQYLIDYDDFINKLVDKESVQKLSKDSFIKLFKMLEVSDDKNVYQHLTKLLYNKKIKPLNGVKTSQTIEQHHMEKYLANKLNKYHIDQDGFSEYDKNMIMFEWKLGKYKKMLNTYENNDFDSYNDLTNKLNQHNKQFNRNTYSNVYNKLYLHNYDINDVTNEYIFGLHWVFDQYFNRNDKDTNLNNVSTWFYPYERGPLLINISEKIGIFNNFDLSKYMVERGEYMNKTEQLIYTMPLKKILNDPYLLDKKKYKEFAKQHPEICPDLDEQINQIWENTGGNTNFYIDCRRVTFITKCVLEKVSNMSYINYMKIIKPLRK